MTHRGTLHCRQYGVIPEPDVYLHTIQDDDVCVVMATDGYEGIECVFWIYTWNESMIGTGVEGSKCIIQIDVRQTRGGRV